jgi:hypothetical protein
MVSKGCLVVLVLLVLVLGDTEHKRRVNYSTHIQRVEHENSDPFMIRYGERVLVAKTDAVRPLSQSKVTLTCDYLVERRRRSDANLPESQDCLKASIYIYIYLNKVRETEREREKVSERVRQKIVNERGAVNERI